MHAYKREESLVPWFGVHICIYQCSAVDFGSYTHMRESKNEGSTDGAYLVRVIWAISLHRALPLSKTFLMDKFLGPVAFTR